MPSRKKHPVELERFDDDGHVVERIKYVGTPGVAVTEYEFDAGRLLGDRTLVGTRRRLESETRYEYEGGRLAREVSRTTGDPERWETTYSYSKTRGGAIQVSLRAKSSTTGHVNRLYWSIVRVDDTWHAAMSNSVARRNAQFAENAVVYPGSTTVAEILTASTDGWLRWHASRQLGERAGKVVKRDQAGRPIEVAQSARRVLRLRWRDRGRTVEVRAPLYPGKDNVEIFTFGPNGCIREYARFD